jgi:hypothetical protein
MTITISRDCPAGSARRAYRIECPDDARFYTDPADAHETILIPGPEHRNHPERSAWLRLDDAIDAAREGRYGLRLISEEELTRDGVAEVACVGHHHADPKIRSMTRRHFMAVGTIEFVAWAAGTPAVVAGETGDPRFPATTVAVRRGATSVSPLNSTNGPNSVHRCTLELGPRSPFGTSSGRIGI